MSPIDYGRNEGVHEQSLGCGVFGAPPVKTDELGRSTTNDGGAGKYAAYLAAGVRKWVDYSGNETSSLQPLWSNNDRTEHKMTDVTRYGKTNKTTHARELTGNA